jgi:TonB family protein
MSGTNPTRAATRSMSQTVQLAPYLVESICELTRAVRDRTHSQTEISGLLFGNSQSGFTVVEALKNFKDSGPRSELVRRERLDKAFSAAAAEAAQDPELNVLKLVGWFSLRGSSGLLTSDIDFHNRHFKTSEDLALVIWREADTQAIAEVYSKGDDTRLTSDDYRWSSVRLSTEMRRVSEPIDLAMRVKVSEDSYLKTYESTDSDKRDEWKKMADSAKNALLSLLPGRKTGDALDDADPRTTQTWDPAALFRRKGEAAKSYPVTALGRADSLNEPTRIVEPESTLVSGRSARRDHLPEEVSGLPMVISTTRKRRSVMPLVAAGFVFLLFSGVTFGILAVAGSGSGNSKLAQVMRILFPGTDLGVRVDSQGDKLLLSWNRRNPVVASASDAVLQIFDGADHREIKLNAGQVADGAVLYKPVTNDVTFRLEVHGTDQSTVMGSQRVLDATRSTATAAAPLDVSKNSSTPLPPPAPVRPAESAANTRRPVLYRNGEKGRVSVPMPLPATRKPPAETLPPTASGATGGVSSEQNSTPASPAPALAANPQPPAAEGSKINGWDPNAPENRLPPPPDDTTADARTSAFVAPKPLLQVLPSIRALPPGAVSQVTRVSVEVKIDTAGHVTTAHVLNEGAVTSELSSAAVDAARQWTFEPATRRGEKVPSDHTILFEFRPGAPGQDQ